MSDSRSNPSNALVVGTAGHIDHGKTSLIRALTGIDTDQLKEEKRRGISIDLGFAELYLPNGPTISFVDVPGHERFIRNMLAGASGIEAVLLIVAANESVMPQTREHFEICQLMGIKRGLMVLTKCDLAAPDQIAQTKLEIEALVRGSFLANAPIIEVSAVTGQGVVELKNRLAAMVTAASDRDSTRAVRLPIDRSFVLKGHGVVVTGTLAAGSVKTGDVLEVFPQMQKARVRALESQHRRVNQAQAGQRLAINLGGIDQHSIKRGQLLISSDTFVGSRLMDVEMRWVAEKPQSSRELFVLHIGTSEIGARIRIHKNRSAPTEFARLQLAEEVIAVPGDRFVIRRPSPAQTVGGGVVIDPFPPRRLNQSKTLTRLKLLNQADLASIIESLSNEAPNGLAVSELIRITGRSRMELENAIQNRKNLLPSSGDRIVTQQWIQTKRDDLLKWLKNFHESNPNAAGAPLASTRLGLSADLAELVLANFEAIRREGELIALVTHQARFSSAEQVAIERIEAAFRSAGFQPPSLVEVLANSGVNAQKARSLLELLVKNKRLVRLPDDLIFHFDVVEHIRKSLAEHKGLRFSVAEFKTWTNVSRKFAIPLLEYLDQRKITRRDGDFRVVN